jgi:hypothetical protein
MEMMLEHPGNFKLRFYRTWFVNHQHPVWACYGKGLEGLAAMWRLSQPYWTEQYDRYHRPNKGGYFDTGTKSTD